MHRACLPACLPPSQETQREEPARDPLARTGRKGCMWVIMGRKSRGPTGRTPTEPHNEAVPRSSLSDRAGPRRCGPLGRPSLSSPHPALRGVSLPFTLSSAPATRSCPPGGRTALRSPPPPPCVIRHLALETAPVPACPRPLAHRAAALLFPIKSTGVPEAEPSPGGAATRPSPVSRQVSPGRQLVKERQTGWSQKAQRDAIR